VEGSRWFFEARRVVGDFGNMVKCNFLLLASVPLDPPMRCFVCTGVSGRGVKRERLVEQADVQVGKET